MLSIKDYFTCNFRKPKSLILHYNSIIRVCYTYKSELVKARNVLNLGNQIQLAFSKEIREFYTLSYLLNQFNPHLLIFLISFLIEGEEISRQITNKIVLFTQFYNLFDLFTKKKTYFPLFLIISQPLFSMSICII